MMKNEEFRADYIRKIQPTIDRFKARGVKFPVQKPDSAEPKEETKPEDGNKDKQSQEQVNNLPQPNWGRTWSALLDDDVVIG